MMAASRLGRSPTCLNCLRQLAQPTTTSIVSTTSFIQIRTRTTKAELEDLQGIPVRLLDDIVGFGRKHAIIRVKPGRMRNYWFPKGQAEYMTRNRFKELGLTDAAIGVRDRTFGTKLVLEEDKNNRKKAIVEEELVSHKKKEVLTLPPEETQSLLTTILPTTLTFFRKPIATPTPTPTIGSPEVPHVEPAGPRSPSLSVHAATSQSDVSAETPPASASGSTTTPSSIFGSVSTSDILHVVKEALAADSLGNRVALEDESISILGLDEGEDRIKTLGTFEVEISPGKDLNPVRRTVEVVPEA